MTSFIGGKYYTIVEAVANVSIDLPKGAWYKTGGEQFNNRSF
jgi:hypothetical protein